MGDHVSTIARLSGLVEVTRLVRCEEDLRTLLPAIAATVSESLGFATVVINLYRPAWNDFHVSTVHGSEAARTLLLGAERQWDEWEPLLDPNFERHGCYFLPHEKFDWSVDTSLSYVPELAISDDPDAWHPEDALFIPLEHIDGHVLGIMSVDEPASGRRPTEEDLRVLAAVAAHAALAVQEAQAAAESARHRAALEQLLRVSARLTETLSIDSILSSVCDGIRSALGFAMVSIDLLDQEEGRFVPKAAAGWDLAQLGVASANTYEDVERLLTPEFEIEGCFLLPDAEARERVGIDRPDYSSVMNGRGPRAWNHHWLLVPLHDRGGRLVGVIWVDEPEDRLLPSTQRLQALRLFANQASTAVASASQFEEMRFLADHDPLTRLGNRRAFIRRLGVEADRTGRYARTFALVHCDVDDFKSLNDRHGHMAGDEALVRIGQVLRDALRRSDGAFRLGGDEFALMLVEAGPEEARDVVDRISEGLAGIEGGRPGGLRASFGVAIATGGFEDPEALLRDADEAMYAAKRAGERLRFADAS